MCLAVKVYLPLHIMTTHNSKLPTPERAIEHLVHSNNGVEQIRLLSHTIGYLLHGTLRIYNEGWQVIQKNEIYVLGAGCHTIEYYSEDNHPCEDIIIRLHNGSLGSILRNLELDNNTLLPHPNISSASYAHQPASAILTTYYKGLRKYLAKGVVGLSKRMEFIKIHELVYLIFHQPLSLVANYIQQIATQHTSLFQDHIQSNIFKNITIPELAQKCGMCPSTFKITFKRHYGCSPHQWFMAQRMKAVCLALRHTDEPIKNISHNCGFATPSHMIRLFKANYGVTPAQYRLQKFSLPPAHLTSAHLATSSNSTKQLQHY